MLAKLSRGNQLTIPKDIVKRVHLQAGRDYLDVAYLNGVIVLKPVDVEERVPPESYAALLTDAFTPGVGDIVADARSASKVLRKRVKKR